jgi:hypothetical protein
MREGDGHLHGCNRVCFLMKKLLFEISVGQFVSLIVESPDLSSFRCSCLLVSVSLQMI